MSLESRLSLLEKIVGDPDEPLVEQVHHLEAQVNALLAKSGSQNLDFARLAALLPPNSATTTPQLSREAKSQIIEARAAEILAQTNAVPSCIEIPNLEPLDLGSTEREVTECIYEFDETTQRSIHAARIYLEQLNKLK